MTAPAEVLAEGEVVSEAEAGIDRGGSSKARGQQAMGRKPTGEERKLLQGIIARLTEKTKQGKQGWRWSEHGCGWLRTSNFFGQRVEVRCYQNTRPTTLRGSVVAEPKMTAGIWLLTGSGPQEYRIVSAYHDGAEDELVEQVRQLVIAAEETLRQERIGWLQRIRQQLG